MREKYQGICSEIVNDLVDITVRIADYRQANGNHISNSIWNELKMSFLKSQPLFEFVDHFDDVKEDVEEIKNEKQMKVNEYDENDEIVENSARRNSGERIDRKSVV